MRQFVTYETNITTIIAHHAQLILINSDSIVQIGSKEKDLCSMNHREEMLSCVDRRVKVIVWFGLSLTCHISLVKECPPLCWPQRSKEKGCASWLREKLSSCLFKLTWPLRRPILLLLIFAPPSSMTSGTWYCSLQRRSVTATGSVRCSYQCFSSLVFRSLLFSKSPIQFEVLYESVRRCAPRYWYHETITSYRGSTGSTSSSASPASTPRRCCSSHHHWMIVSFRIAFASLVVLEFSCRSCFEFSFIDTLLRLKCLSYLNTPATDNFWIRTELVLQKMEVKTL